MSSNKSSAKNKPSSYIIIGNGFDELEVITFLYKFRHAGLRIQSISLFEKLVYSCQGVGLKADFELADNPINAFEGTLLILPSGGRNGEALRQDARVRSLLHSFSTGSGKLVITNNHCALANDVSDLLNCPTYKPEKGQALAEFVDALAGRLAI